MFVYISLNMIRLHGTIFALQMNIVQPFVEM